MSCFAFVGKQFIVGGGGQGSGIISQGLYLELTVHLTSLLIFSSFLPKIDFSPQRKKILLKVTFLVVVIQSNLIAFLNYSAGKLAGEAPVDLITEELGQHLIFSTEKCISRDGHKLVHKLKILANLIGSYFTNSNSWQGAWHKLSMNVVIVHGGL